MRNLLLSTLLLTLACISITLTSCIKDDYTTSSSDVLTFKTDSVKFDTIFTAQTSAIYRLVVYNRNKKIVKISSISVAGNNDGAKFYLNVDGELNSSFHDVDIRGNDSIYVFVQANIDERTDELPFEINDNIVFVTNGTTQQVPIRAWGQDAITLRKAVIDSDETFSGKKPYIVYDTLYIAKGATLTIDKGVRMCMHDKAQIIVDGTLKVNGETGNMVHFRGDRIDKLVGGTSYDVKSGLWGGIRFRASSMGNELRGVNMRCSSFGLVVDSCGNVADRKLYIFNSILQNSSGNIFESTASYIEARGSQFSDAAVALVTLRGGKNTFVNCTFGNYYLYGTPSGSIVNIPQVAGLEDDTEIQNCIIYGNCTSITPGSFTGRKVYLRNTLLKESGSNDDNFIDCIWGADPLFYVDVNTLNMDYRLKPESPAIAKGKKEFVTESMRYDIYGLDRFESASSGIDLGAFVYKPTE